MEQVLVDDTHTTFEVKKMVNDSDAVYVSVLLDSESGMADLFQVSKQAARVVLNRMDKDQEITAFVDGENVLVIGE